MKNIDNDFDINLNKILIELFWEILCKKESVNVDKFFAKSCAFERRPSFSEKCVKNLNQLTQFHSGVHLSLDLHLIRWNRGQSHQHFFDF